MKRLGTTLLVIILILVIAGIAFVGYGFYRKQTMEVKNPIVTMEIENFGTVKMELYPDQAPNTVANFIKLAERGFYNDSTFHRIIKDFMIQGGDKEKGDGTGSAKLKDIRDGGADEAYCIKGEFTANNVNNTIPFEEGTLAMARSDYTQYSADLVDESYNSESSQFFIMTERNISLNGYYTGFGKVIEGMDVVKKVAEVEVTKKSEADASGEEEATVESTEENSEESSANEEVSTPVDPPKIKTVTVDTFGYNYGDPETVEPFDYMSWIYKQYGIDPSSMTTTTGE